MTVPLVNVHILRGFLLARLRDDLSCLERAEDGSRSSSANRVALTRNMIEEIRRNPRPSRNQIQRWLQIAIAHAAHDDFQHAWLEAAIYYRRPR